MQLKRFAASTDVGLQRSNNEDCYLCSPENGLWLVADGMGGHAAGEVASEIASNTIRDAIVAGSSLVDSIQDSHHAVLRAVSDGIGGHGMGSTIVAVQTLGSHYEVAWVGDSRAYLWSPDSHTPIRQITRDHSYVQMLYENGAIAEEELLTHPEKNIITQCLGSMDLDRVQVESVQGEWQDNELIILCSDGLSDYVSKEEMTAILSEENDLNRAVQSLMQRALQAGGRDNITIVAINAPDNWILLTDNIKKFFHKLRAY